MMIDSCHQEIPNPTKTCFQHRMFRRVAAPSVRHRGLHEGVSRVWSQREQLAAATLSGILLGLSQPLVVGSLGQRPILPGASGLLVLIGCVPVLVLMRRATWKEAFVLGWVAGVVNYAILMYWVVIALDMGGVRLALAVMLFMLMVTLLSAIKAASFAITRAIVHGVNLPQWVAFPVCFTGVEFALNNAPFQGFPWGSVGNAFATVAILLQGASLFGVYGLTFFIASMNSATAEWVCARIEKHTVSRRVTVCGMIFFFSMITYGAVRLMAEETPSPSIKVGLLQGNIAPSIKNDARRHHALIIDRYQLLQDAALNKGAELIVWPELALPYPIETHRTDLLDDGIVPRQERATTARRELPAAIIGAASFTFAEEVRARKGRPIVHNSAFYIGPQLNVIGRSDKRRLVPFAEYVPWPLRGVVPALFEGQVTPGKTLTTTVLPLPGGHRVRVGTTICFESAFPEMTRSLTKNGAEIIFDLTNDAWFGISSGPVQHLAQAILRAVESGRSVVRVANTGITAWIDGHGHVHDATRLFESASVVADIPRGSKTTPYVLLGDWVAFPCLIAMIALWCGVLSRRLYPYAVYRGQFTFLSPKTLSTGPQRNGN